MYNWGIHSGQRNTEFRRKDEILGIRLDSSHPLSLVDDQVLVDRGDQVRVMSRICNPSYELRHNPGVQETPLCLEMRSCCL